MLPINLRNIILASGSPRRKELLEHAGFAFNVQAMDIDESFPEDMPSYEVAEYIAEKKAIAAKELIVKDEIIITADSVVVLQDTIFGKPVDKNDAFRILSFLSGKIHKVYTGVCLMDRNQTIKFTGKSEVMMRPMNKDEIDWYIDTYKPYDKAGAYAVQEWIGLCKISRIEGSYTNIMGLPVDLVYEGLKKFEGALRFEL